MTGRMTIDRETLAAFADGELSPEEAAEVAVYLADHPEEQAWVDEVMAANIALRRAFSAPAREPVPDRFRDLILPEAAPAANVVPLRRPSRPALVGGLVGAGLALAAALAAVAILPAGDAAGLQVGPVAAGSALDAALTTFPSGETRSLEDGTLTILASLPTDRGICREVELFRPAARQIQLGIACRDEAVWAVEVMLAEPVTAEAAEAGYAPAFGSDAQALEAWLDSRGAGAALAADEETAAMARGWTR